MTLKEFLAGVGRGLAVNAVMIPLLTVFFHVTTGQPLWSIFGDAVCIFGRVFGGLYAIALTGILLDRIFGTGQKRAIKPPGGTSNG